MKNDSYISPFSERYCSKDILELFSPYKRALLFRSLWISLAKSQKNLGLPITDFQISEMEKNKENINFECIQKYELETRHDVMAHLKAFAEICPNAKPILHLGATSCFVTDNADLILYKEALQNLFKKLQYVLFRLSELAINHAKAPCLSFTHYQPAQPTTIGKRFALWMQDLLIDAKEWKRIEVELPFLGVKGTTGTQSSFLALFDGDGSKVQALESALASEFNFNKTIYLSGQTYTRKIDISLLQTLASFGSSTHKIATDIRLLSHDGEINEPFSNTQVGSSAMPYKQNPIYSERICGLSRYLMTLPQNALFTQATQWLERTLDDSSNRRIVFPEAFLATDAILSLLAHLLDHLQISTKSALEGIEKNVAHLCMENLLMIAVKKGGDRQEIHSYLKSVKNSRLSGKELGENLGLSEDEIKKGLDLMAWIGRAPEQVEIFLSQEWLPFYESFPEKISPNKVSF